MLKLLLAAIMTTSPAEIPPDAWTCNNQIEVWCTADGCAATEEDETTPLDVWASRGGRFSVCAYSGCWEGETALVETGGRLLWAADNVPFLSGRGGPNVNVTLVIIEKEGVGFVRAGGFATPLLCTRATPDAG